MRLAAARLFPLLLVLALALLTFWLERAVRVEEKHPSLRRHDPDFIIENFRTENHDPSGGVESLLTARRMLHYPDDDSTELALPRVVVSKRDRPRVEFSALRGAISQDGEEVFLFDEVLVRREASDARPEVRIETSVLHYIRSRSMVRSDRDVRITEEGRTISGRGLEYDMDAERFAVRERVRGRFEPRKGER